MNYFLNVPFIGWLQAWRSHIAKAKADPVTRDGYCRAAAIAQAAYVMSRAIFVVDMERVR